MAPLAPLSDGQAYDIAQLCAHEYFGEMSLLTEDPRSATVKAETECLVLEISKETMAPMMAAGLFDGLRWINSLGLRGLTGWEGGTP